MANGDVAPCCRGVMIPTGNLHKQRFKDIWNGMRQQRFRSTGLEIMKHKRFMENVGCEKMCDNIMHNKEIYDLLQ
jgi:hypothetical protein